MKPYTPRQGQFLAFIREGVEDYEYFVMLRGMIDQAKAAGKAGPAIAAAETLLTNGAQQVLAAQGADKLLWRDRKDRGQADTLRVEVLCQLITLSRQPTCKLLAGQGE
jgi:hypothetical protein